MIDAYKLCAIVGTMCFVLITIYLVRLLNQANKTLTEIHETNKQVNEIVTDVKGALSFVKPLFDTMKDAKKMLEQIRMLMGTLKDKKEEVKEKIENRQKRKKTRKR